MRGIWQLGDDELLDALRQSRDRLNREYGHQLHLIGELLVRGLTQAKGYRTTPQLLRDLMRVSQAEANRLLAHATAVTAEPSVTGPDMPPPLPATADAVRAGAISAEHVETIRRVITTLPPEVQPEQRELAERTLAQAAHTLDPGAIAKLGRHLHARLDQDGRPPTDTELRNPLNELRWITRADDTVDLKGRLAAEAGALLVRVLGPLAKPRPTLDGERDHRSRAERHGDALADVLRLAASSGQLPVEGGERPALQVTVSLDALTSQTGTAILGHGTHIDARQARRLACDSAVIPIVLGGRAEPLDIGRKTRTIPAGMRRALALRDRGCAFPGCAIPAPWCDTHHRRHWVDGGETSLHNLLLLCGLHHELIHHSEWHVGIAEDGHPQFTPPAYIDPDQRPRRNPIHPRASSANGIGSSGGLWARASPARLRRQRGG